MGIGSGKLRNDVWIGQLTSGSQSPWRVDDRYFVDGATHNPDLIRSKMRWYEATPGRIGPATWPAGPKYSQPLTNDEWIACQDSIKDRLDYTIALPDPSICNEPPQFCYDDLDTPGCHAQAVWKKDNMWSPRRGLGAAVANGKIFVIGGQAREYARINDSRLVGGLGSQKRVETIKEHSTIREDLVLKNDIWSSSDGGITWELVNPGCKDPQEDVLLQTEVWSRNNSDSSLPKIVGSIGSKCYMSSDCYGVAECKELGNTSERVCVCPMFSPRKNHAVAVQHRYSVLEDGSVFAEDVMYVVGGFTSVKQAFCANRSCGPSDGYRLAIDDAWMSTDGVNWIQIKPAFSRDSSFRGRGSHTALVVRGRPNDTNATEIERQRDRLLIFGGETSSPQELTTSYLNDVWQVSLPKEPCCIPAKGCIDTTKAAENKGCIPSLSDWSAVTSEAEWLERSGHTSVYEPPSSSNAFQHQVYLSGGKDATKVFSDVWTWNLENDANWECDFCSGKDDDKNITKSAHNVFLCKDSPLEEVRRYQLPSLNQEGQLFNFTNHSMFPIVRDKDFAIMATEGVNTVKDLASADVYKVLKLRGFEYPGRKAEEVPSICHLREISIAITEKCSLKVPPSSHFHKMALRKLGGSSTSPTPISCGRGGETAPCVRGDWDGCSPIPGATKVDVHGLGYVSVPQILHNVSRELEEIFCRQVPEGRYSGTAEFLDSKVVLLGGISHNSTRLFRDVWMRDHVLPQAVITTKPLSGSPQSQFYFDSNEVGAHVFEYKLIREGVDIIPWTVTTKNLGVNVDWLDNKNGGPGRGWYTLFIRAVDPSGNRDSIFSTQTNVYRWYYVPPIPWGAVTGYVISALVLIAAGYYEYRRRKRKATLERFHLRRMKRKFKLKAAVNEVHNSVFKGEIPEGLDIGGGGASGLRRRRSKALRPGSRGSRNSSAGRHSRSRRDRSSHDEERKSHRTRAERTHSRSKRERSHSRSRSRKSSTSRQRSKSHDKAHHPGSHDRRRRRKKKTPEDRAESEARDRRRRDRAKLRRQL